MDEEVRAAVGQLLGRHVGPVAARDRVDERVRPAERRVYPDVVGGCHCREDLLVVGRLDDLGVKRIPVDRGDRGVLRLRREVDAECDQGSLWMSSTQWTCSGFGSTSGRSRFTTT